LAISMAIAMIGVGLLFLYVKRFERDASGGAPVTLLVATKPIEVGTVLTDAMLAPRDVPIAYVESRAVRASEKARVLGLRVSTRVQPQQTVMWTDMAITADDRRDLSSLVEPGMRAITVRAKGGGNDRANELIRPGDRVDLVLTTSGATDKDPQVSKVLLQNVLVLAVGLDTGNDSAASDKHVGASHDSVLTLSLTIREAQIESLAAEKGRLSVALRNPDDVRVIDGLADVSFVSTPPTAAPDARPHAASAADAPAGPVRLERAQVARREALR
jgi:pilus assembly protein CpaB